MTAPSGVPVLRIVLDQAPRGIPAGRPFRNDFKPLREIKPLLRIPHFLILVAAMYSPADLHGQIRGTVKGTVTDAETGAPLGNTNVYLSSTTIGTNTGTDGRYVLTNIPQGIFQVVASRVGHRVKSALIHVSHAETLHADFTLEPVTLQGEEVQVIAHVDKEWRRLLAEFTKAFLGEGRNAPECTLLNPEVLDLRMERETGILIASTDSVLWIENRALGYRLYARLGVFEWDRDDDRGRFVLYPRFEQLTSWDSTEQTRWHLNRIRSYSGSLKHFLASLVAGTVEQEGFLVSPGTLTELQAGTSRPLLPDDFTLLPVEGESLWKLTFERWLRVEYRGDQKRLKSLIALNGNTAIFGSAGNLVNPLCFTVIGDWTKYRVADMLPID
jgi:hypothetical protein